MYLLVGLVLLGLGQEPGRASPDRSIAVLPGEPVRERLEYSGRVHVWALGEGDLSLRIDDAEGVLLAEDDDSGGGTVPYLALPVQSGKELVVRVFSKSETAERANLWIAHAPESERTRATLRRAPEVREEISDLQRDGDALQARERLGSFAAELEAIEDAEESGAIARVRGDLGLLAYTLGDARTSADLWSATARFLERTRPPDHLELLKFLGNLGLALREAGDLTEATALQERVAEACQRTLPAEHPDRLAALANLSIARKEGGDLAGGGALESELLATLDRTRPANDPDLLGVRNNLATTLFLLGDLPGAREHFTSALAGYEAIRPPGDLACLRLRVNLASVLAQIGEREAARAELERVLDEGGRSLPAGHPELLRAQLNLATLVYDLGDSGLARETYERVLVELTRTLPADHPDVLSARLNLAIVLGDLGEREECLERLTGVLADYERSWPRSDRKLLLARFSLFLALSGADRVDEAHHELAEFVEGLIDRSVACFGLASREASEALAKDASWLRSVLLVGSGAGRELETRIFDLIETRRLATSAIARSSALIASNPALREAAREVAVRRSALQDLVLSTGGEGGSAEEHAARVARASLERDAAEGRLRRSLAAHGVVAEAIDAGVLAGRLPEGSVAVGYLRVAGGGENDPDTEEVAGSGRLLAHVLGSDGVPVRIDLGPTAELDRLVSAWRASLGTPIETRGVSVPGARPDPALERQAGAALRARLVDPVLGAVGKPPKALYICADDLVHLVPLDGLPSGSHDEDGRLGDTVRVVLWPSFGMVARPAAPSDAPPSLAALGGVDYDGTSLEDAVREHGAGSRYLSGDAPLAPLPGTQAEIDSIRDLHARLLKGDAQILKGSRASKATLVAILPGRRFVHLATHGWFAPESRVSLADAGSERTGARGRTRVESLEQTVAGFAPMTLCGLALAGANVALRGEGSGLGSSAGILTAEELCAVDLSRCELAVLSACETNAGIRRAGQGMQSLQAALHAAGARSAITSLWRVDDAATRELMERFYTYLWQEHLPKADALWRAKLDLRKAGHPIRNWAGWVLSGDPL